MDDSPKKDITVRVFTKFLQSNTLLYFVILLLVLKIFAVLISINIPQNIFFADITRAALENFTNQARQAVGLQPLTENAQLDQAARLKAENMVRNQYFDHTSPTGVTAWYWFSLAGYNYKYAGENLAIGFYDSQEVYNAWLNSPEHKANMLNPNYKEVGTAVLSGFGANNSIVVVQEFGSPLQAKITSPALPAKPVVKNIPATKTNPAPAITGERVLSQATDALPAKVINSVIYNPDGILQDVVYGVSMIVIGVLLTLILFSFKINFKKQLVFRSILLIVLLCAATLLDKGFIISLIPHQVII